MSQLPCFILQDVLQDVLNNSSIWPQYILANKALCNEDDSDL